jgi:hypothetical protein
VPAGQVPHISVPPQVSLIVPHVLFCAAQLWGAQHVPLWQLSLLVHAPHMIVPPQPSLWFPQAFATHVFGVQATHALPVHVCPIGHAPQLTCPVPQPLPIVPQCPWQTGSTPHTPGTPPPPHVSGAVHAAH